MPKNEIKPAEQRIKSFAFRLKNDFGEEIGKGPFRLKARVIGTLKAVLPRQRPSRKGNAEIKQVAEIYTTLYVLASSLIAQSVGGLHGPATNTAASRGLEDRK